MLRTQNYNFMPGLGGIRSGIQGVYVFSYVYKYLTLNKEKAKERTVQVRFFFCKCPLFSLKPVAVRRLHFNYS